MALPSSCCKPSSRTSLTTPTISRYGSGMAGLPLSSRDLLADGIGGGPIFARHGRVDDDDGRRGSIVAGGEGAATQDGDAIDVEIVPVT